MKGFYKGFFQTLVKPLKMGENSFFDKTIKGIHKSFCKKSMKTLWNQYF